VAIHACAPASADVGDAFDGAPLSLPLAEADGDPPLHPPINRIASSTVATIVAATKWCEERLTSIND
jgi:hypothetical protein